MPLGPMTTLGVGGAARYFATATTAKDVSDAVDFARSGQLPLFVLGGGSNLLVADTGFRGVVLKVAIRGLHAESNDDGVVYTVGAGEDWDAFVAQAVTLDYAGVECLSGIPGTVGGTPVQNVGAYGQEVSDTIRLVETFDLKTGRTKVFCHDECEFGYRESRFNTSERGRYVILRVAFQLQRGGKPNISYGDLKKIFVEHSPTLAETREAVRAIRHSKGMLIVEGDEDCRSAGSFFKNPVLAPAAYAALKERVAKRGLMIPSYPALASKQKIPAAWLVEQAGFLKGYRQGRVGISRKHALALVNLGGATAAEVIALKDQIQRAVADQFDVELHPEPVFVGFENSAGAAGNPFRGRST